MQKLELPKNMEIITHSISTKKYSNYAKVDKLNKNCMSLHIGPKIILI